MSVDAEPQRLQKVLAHAGVASRRAVEEMIEAGRIEVNGRVARLGQRVDPAKDEVKVDGSRVPLAADLVHALFNKPAGVVTTSADPQQRATVIDMVDLGARVWPVGRLDLDSEGALLLTNDGDLTQRLTHPRYHVPKTYLVEVAGGVPHRSLRALQRGVELEDGVSRPLSARIVERKAGATSLEVVFAEGRNRQVRRTLDALGHPVRRLVRVAIGPLRIGRLKPGSYRRLGPAEVSALYRAVGL